MEPATATPPASPPLKPRVATPPPVAPSTSPTLEAGVWDTLASPLPPLAALLSLVLGGMALWRILMMTGPYVPALAWLGAVSAAVAFAVATFAWNRRDLGQWANPLAALLVELLLINVLASFAVAGDTRSFTLFLVVSVGLAGWLLQPAWFFLTWVVGGAIWLSIAMMVDRPWETQLGRVAGAFGLSTLLLVARHFVWRRQLDLAKQEEAERQELAVLRSRLAEAKEEQNRVEEELAREHARQQRLVDATSELLSEHDEAGKFLFATPSCVALLGYNLSTLLGQTLNDLVHPDETAALQAARTAVLKQKDAQTLTHRLRRQDGTFVWVETRLQPVRQSEVRPVLAFMARCRDLTVQRELEADWLAAEKEQQQLSTRIAQMEQEQQRLEAAWQAADAARLQAHRQRQQMEDEKRKESTARAEAEADRIRLRDELDSLKKQAVTMSEVPLPGLPVVRDDAGYRHEIDRLLAEKRRLELDFDQEKHARQRAEAQQRTAEETLQSTETLNRKLEGELRTLRTDHQQTEAAWQESEAKRDLVEKDRQRLRGLLTTAESDLQKCRLETEEARQEGTSLKRQLDQLRLTLHDSQQRRSQAEILLKQEGEQGLRMLRELPVLLLNWDATGKLKQIAGGGFELLSLGAGLEPGADVTDLATSSSFLAEPLAAVLVEKDYQREFDHDGRSWACRCSPWKNELGEVRGLLGLLSDVSALKRQLREKRKDASRAEVRLEPESVPAIRLLPAEPPEEEAAVEGPLPRFTGKVLLVDDRREPQRVMTFMLERLGLEVEMADFLDQAEDQALTGRYDLIFFARAMLRKEKLLPAKLRERGVAAPIIAVMEAEASTAQEAKCREVGCDGVLRQPLTPMRLAETLTSYLMERETDPSDPTLELPVFSRHRQDPAFSGLIKSFIDELPGKVAELWSALCVADLAQLVKGVHQLKEAAELYGYPELAQKASRLEQAVVEGQAAAALRTFLKDVERLTRRCERGLAA